MSEAALSRRLFGREARLGLGLSLPIILIMGALVFVPLILTFIDSFYRIDPTKPGTPFVWWKNYATMLGDKTTQISWFNTLLCTLMAVVIETVGGLAAALTLHKVARGRRWLLAAVVLPWCLPPVVNAILWMWIYNPSYGLLNAVLSSLHIIQTNQVWFNNRWTGLFLIALVHAWRMMPLSAIIFLAALQTIPASLYEAARLDGASAWKQFRAITLPLIASALAIALSQSTVFALNLFDEAWILNGNAIGTRPVMVQVYLTAFQNLKFSQGMALSILVMLASLAISALYVLRVYRETRFE